MNKDLFKYEDGYLYHGWYIRCVGGFITSKHWIATKEQPHNLTFDFFWADTRKEAIAIVDGKEQPLKVQLQPLY